MAPRIITRTHYQVDEPAYLRILISVCSSATKSEYQEHVAKRLTSELGARGQKVNFAAAKYCVDLARSLDLLSSNYFWTPTAHAAALLSKPDQRTALDLQLSIEEGLFWFRVFLEHDGAALQFFARKIVTNGEVPGPNKDWNHLANEMTNYVYNGYLSILQDIRDRADIREVLARRQRQPYKGKSGPHQCFIHVNTLYRTGLLTQSDRKYRRPDNSELGGAVDRFVSLAPDVSALEGVLATIELPMIVGRVFWGELKPPRWADEEILEAVYELYRRVSATGASLCPLSTLMDTIQVRHLCQREVPISREQFMAVLRRAQSKEPKKIRFHVDRLGRPAFIVFS